MPKSWPLIVLLPWVLDRPCEMQYNSSMFMTPPIRARTTPAGINPQNPFHPRKGNPSWVAISYTPIPPENNPR